MSAASLRRAHISRISHTFNKRQAAWLKLSVCTPSALGDTVKSDADRAIMWELFAVRLPILLLTARFGRVVLYGHVCGFDVCAFCASSVHVLYALSRTILLTMPDRNKKRRALCFCILCRWKASSWVEQLHKPCKRTLDRQSLVHMRVGQ